MPSKISNTLGIRRFFTLFLKLPVAIRRKSWITAIPRRVVVLYYDTKNSEFITHEPNISLLFVSREARESALQIMLSTFNTTGSSRTIYINVEQDMIFLDPGRHGDLGQILIQWRGALSLEHIRKIGKLDIGLYENRKESAMNCIESLGETILLDQARAGLPFTQIRLIAHAPVQCILERHTAQIFTVDCGSQMYVNWEQELVAKVRDVNQSMLEIARYYWGSEMNDTYGKFVHGPIKLELHHGFCGIKGIEG